MIGYTYWVYILASQPASPSLRGPTSLEVGARPPL